MCCLWRHTSLATDKTHVLLARNPALTAPAACAPCGLMLPRGCCAACTAGGGSLAYGLVCLASWLGAAADAALPSPLLLSHGSRTA